jgi:hypothetical protein
MPNKTSDFQLPKSENLPTSLRSHATKMKNSRNDFNKSEVMPAERLLNIKTRLPCWDKNFKDLMESSKERTTRSEPWEEKSNKPKKTSDFPTPNKANYQWSSINTRAKSKSQIKNQKPTDKRCKNFWPKTTAWETKLGMLNKT